jgi:hypothetical protein
MKAVMTVSGKHKNVTNPSQTSTTPGEKNDKIRNSQI